MAVPKSAPAAQLIRRISEASNPSLSAIEATQPDSDTIKDIKIKEALLKDLRNGMPIDAAFNAAATMAKAAIQGTGAAPNVYSRGTAVPAGSETTRHQQQPTAGSSKKNDKENSLHNLSPQCCLCEKVPRINEDDDVHISQSENGHLQCQECNLQLIECPICRSKSKARNRFAENYVKKYYSNTATKCSHLTCPASLTMSAGELLLHEKYCVHQEVHCFDKTQCSYLGPFNKLFKLERKDMHPNNNRQYMEQ